MLDLVLLNVKINQMIDPIEIELSYEVVAEMQFL